MHSRVMTHEVITYTLRAEWGYDQLDWGNLCRLDRTCAAVDETVGSFDSRSSKTLLVQKDTTLFPLFGAK